MGIRRRLDRAILSALADLRLPGERDLRTDRSTVLDILSDGLGRPRSQIRDALSRIRLSPPFEAIRRNLKVEGGS